jgi:hypothetical protein
MFLSQLAIIPISVSFAGTIPLIQSAHSAMVTVTTGTHAPTAHRVYLGSNVVTHISDSTPRDDRMDFMRTFLTPSTFESSDVTLVMEAREALIGPDEKSIGAWLAIGPTSDLTHSFGSVALVAGGDPRLLLGSSEDDFVTRHCEPGFAVRVPISNIPPRTMDGGPAHKIGTRGFLQVNRELIVGLFEYSPISTILDVPMLHFRTMFAAFVQRGIVSPQDDRTMLISTCTPELIAEFPPITVGFTDAGVGSRLVITPAEYIVDNHDGTCQMRISIYNEFLRKGAHPFGFNPLSIPNMIVRSTNTDMLLCKSRQES